MQPLDEHTLQLEAIGASEAALGMTRQMKAVLYGQDLFIEQRRGNYWHAHLEQDWMEGEHGPALNCSPATGLNLLDAHTRHAAHIPPTNKFSWSYSRAAKYRRCPRAYYYHYYAAWGGWQKESPGPVRRAYLLKNLTDIPRWVGTLVHESIKFAMARLKAGQPVAKAALIKQMHRRAQADFEDSRSGSYRQTPGQVTGFQEHYYQTSLSESGWQAAWAKAEHCLRNFLNSALYADLQRKPPHTFLDVETLKSFPVAGTLAGTPAGTKVWVQMDLARHEDEMIYLYDWKTGQIDPQELRQQLAVYGLYIQHAWPEWANLPIVGIGYALSQNRLLQFDLHSDALRAAQQSIKTSVAQLQELLVDPQANLAELRRFPMIDNLSVCRQCQFRELCGRDELR